MQSAYASATTIEMEWRDCNSLMHDTVWFELTEVARLFLLRPGNKAGRRGGWFELYHTQRRHIPHVCRQCEQCIQMCSITVD